MQATKVHGDPIIGFLQTEVQSGKVCGYIIVEKDTQYVVSWYRDGDSEWASGTYIDKTRKDSKVEAVYDMIERASRYLYDRS